MLIKKMLVAAILAVLMTAPFSAKAQQAGTVAGMTPAVAAAAGLGVVLAGVLIANEIGSSGGSQLIPPEPEPEPEPPPPTTPTTPATPATPTTPGT